MYPNALSTGGTAARRRASSRFRALAPVIVVATLLCVGGCPLSFEQTLPADLNPALRYVFEHKEAFAEPDPLPTDVGSTVASLAGVVGCWGAYAPDAARGEESVRIDVYQAYEFRGDGTAEVWNMTVAGGLYPAVFVNEQRYEILGENRIRVVGERTRAYNPFDRRYEVFTDNPPTVAEYLATLVGDELRLRIIEDGDETPGPADMVFRRMDCEP